MSDENSNSPPAGGTAPAFGFKPDEIRAFDGTGYEFVQLHAPNALDARGRPAGKAPCFGWRGAVALDAEQAGELLASGVNAGVRLRPTDLVVDVDPRNFAPGDEPVSRLEKALDIRLDDWPHVVTGSGGSHFYMRVPVGFLASDSLEDYQGIEFKGHGRQVVAPGSSHPITRQPYTWDDDPLATPISDPVRAAPERLLDLIRRPEPTGGAEPGELNPEQLDTLLEGLDPAAYRDESKWRELMMASHHATGGDGREEFIAWSTSDPQYADDGAGIGRRWDSLHADSAARRVTVKTLYKALHEAGHGNLIDEATRSSAEEDFAEVDIPDFVPHEPEGEARQRVHALAEKWVWVTKAEQFISRRDCQRLSPFQFKSHYQHLWKGDILADVWKGKLPIRKYAACVYVPGEGEVSQRHFPSVGRRHFSFVLWVELKPDFLVLTLRSLEGGLCLRARVGVDFAPRGIRGQSSIVDFLWKVRHGR